MSVAQFILDYPLRGKKIAKTQAKFDRILDEVEHNIQLIRNTDDREVIFALLKRNTDLLESSARLNRQNRTRILRGMHYIHAAEKLIIRHPDK